MFWRCVVDQHAGASSNTAGAHSSESDADVLVFCAAYQWDYVFDWTVLKYQQSQATRRVHREPAATGNNTTPEEDEEGRIK